MTFQLKIQGYKTKSLFDTGDQVSCIFYSCYRQLSIESKIDTKVRLKAISADGSSLGPLKMTIYSVILGSYEFDHKFMVVCKNVLCSAILGLNLAKIFKAVIDWNSQGQLYLHQDYKPLTHSV